MMTAGAAWMAVAICQPELSVLWDMDSLTMPAMREPKVRHSCIDPTKNPLRDDGAISD